MQLYMKLERIAHLACPGIPKAVLFCLARHSDSQGKCWPSQATIAAETGFATRTVRKALATLESWGAIARAVRPGHSDIFYVAALLSPRHHVPTTPAPRAYITTHRTIHEPRRIHGILACHLCGKRPSATDSPGSLCLACTRRERTLLRRSAP